MEPVALQPEPLVTEPAVTQPVTPVHTAPLESEPLVTSPAAAAGIDPSMAATLFTNPSAPPADKVLPDEPIEPIGRPADPIQPGRVEPGFSVDSDDPTHAAAVDEVMVEADASTEGYRTSDFRTILEWLAVVGSALAVALLIKAFVLQAFWIPSESMETTVNEGDRILVNKMSYRLHEVRRGDLVVFRKLEGTPGDTDDLIKRAIALPGETIEVRDDGRIWIWGAGETPEQAKLLDEPYLDPGNAFFDPPTNADSLGNDIWDERCTNTRTPGRCTLDDNSLFMLGDNRFASSDSRFFGPVPQENVVGRAFFRIWPLGDISTL